MCGEKNFLIQNCSLLFHLPYFLLELGFAASERFLAQLVKNLENQLKLFLSFAAFYIRAEGQQNVWRKKYGFIDMQ
jgi:hypothetical protein